MYIPLAKQYQNHEIPYIKDAKVGIIRLFIQDNSTNRIFSLKKIENFYF